MWKPWKRHGAEDPESCFPAGDEFWLMHGIFRDWAADQAKTEYYGLCSCSSDGICPPGERPSQDQFYRAVYGVIKELLQNAPSAILVEDMSRSGKWAEQREHLKQMTANSGGTFLEEHSQQKDSYAFLFSEMPLSFLEKIYWWMAELSCKEDIYVQYRALGQTALGLTSISKIKENTCLNILIDEAHPVLVLQLAPNYPIKQVTAILNSVCGQEGWSFSLK